MSNNFVPVVMDGWLPLAALSPNARGHWRTRAGATKRTRHDVWFRVMAAHWPRQAEDDPPRRLTITLRKRGTLYDKDNSYAICKAVIDGVRETGALWDDAPRWADLVVIQEKGPARTTLEMTELPTSDTMGADDASVRPRTSQAMEAHDVHPV